VYAFRGVFLPSEPANTAEELGRRYRITREKADGFALRSQTNAKTVRDAGWFGEEIEPVLVQRDGASEAVAVKSDTHILDDVSLAKMSRLAPASRPAGRPPPPTPARWWMGRRRW